MASLLPNGKQYYVDNAGLPLVGGKLYTYMAGTTTPKATYSDADGTVPNTNPVVMDARGEATVFWTGSYRVVLTDSLDNIIWTVDKIAEPNSQVITSTNGSLAVPAGTTAQRDNPANAGYFRYNLELDCFEGYYDPEWISLLRSVNGTDLPDGGDLQLKMIGDQDLVGTGEILFKKINGRVITGPGDIVVQQHLISGVNLKTVGNVSLLGSGDVPVASPSAANLFLYQYCGGL